MKINCCRDCGAKLPDGASFCPECGSDVRTEEAANFEDKIADFSDGANQAMSARGANSGKLTKLFSLLWLSAIIAVVSVIAGCFDVLAYCDLGREGYILINSGLLIPWIWLYLAMMRRKSWARKMFIALTLLIAVAFVACIFLDGFDLSANMVLDLADLVIQLYCVYLCFGEEVVSAFKSDSRVRGLRAAVNRHHCMVFVAVSVMLLFLYGLMLFLHKGTDEWCKDCTIALKEDIIKFIAKSLAEQGVENPVDRAREYVEERIIGNNSRNKDSHDKDDRESERGEHRKE